MLGNGTIPIDMINSFNIVQKKFKNKKKFDSKEKNVYNSIN